MFLEGERRKTFINASICCSHRHYNDIAQRRILGYLAHIHCFCVARITSGRDGSVCWYNRPSRLPHMHWHSASIGLAFTKAAKMESKTLLAYAFIVALVGGGLWLTGRVIARRRAYKIRQKGRGKRK